MDRPAMRWLACVMILPLVAACAEAPTPAAAPATSAAVPAAGEGEIGAQPWSSAPTTEPATVAPPGAALDPDTPVSAPAATSAPATPAEPGCGLDRARRYIGRQATPAVRTEVAAAVGRRPIRWIGPGDAVTMDFSEQRLNIMLDAAGTITTARCG